MFDVRSAMSDVCVRRRGKAFRRHAARATSHIAHRRSNIRSRGLTLLELLLALAGTAVIGSAVAAMLTGVIYGTATDKDMRSLITRQMALRTRVEAEVRESYMLLDSGSDYMILWAGDTNEDGLPSKAEIQVIEYDAVMDRVMRYAPAPLITDVDYALTDDFRTATNSYKGDSTFPGERWAEQINSFALTLDHIDPQSSRLVSFRFGMAGGEVSYTGIGAATIRNEVNAGEFTIYSGSSSSNSSSNSNGGGHHNNGHHGH